MSNRRIMSLLLVWLMAVAAASRLLSESDTALHVVWLMFLYALPVALLAGLQMRAGWIALACVMYATVGLALDISTAIHDLTHQQAGPVSLALSGISGLTNFLLIVFGGREFLEAGLWTPPADHPPDPPPPQAA